MFDLLRRKSRSSGSVIFPGSLPMPLDGFRSLEQEGFSLEANPGDDESLWTATLRHPQWGEAELICPRQSHYPPRELLEFDGRLTQSEVDAISSSGSSIMVTMLHEQQNVLRERKLALRMMNAVLGEHGISVADHGSQRFWSRAALQEELAHDADLDIESLFILHAVQSDDESGGRVDWLHTHGLAELGYFDFDILSPSDEVVSGCGDLTRALAFAIVEERIQPNGDTITIASPGGDVRMVPVDQFHRNADPSFNLMREDPERTHWDRRAVVCEPAGGWISKMFGKSLEPSRWLRGPMHDNLVLAFSSESTRLMAERARGSYALCRRYAEEFREMEVKPLLKFGLAVDGIHPEDEDREHLWFEATRLGEDDATGILLNEPWNISGMKPGTSYSYPIELLSGWTVFTPVGPITPTEGIAVRILREKREEILQALKER